MSACLQVSLPNSISLPPSSLPAFLPSLPLSTCVILLLFAQQAAAVCPHHSLPLYLLARSCCWVFFWWQKRRKTLGNSYSLRLDSLVFTNGWSLFPSKHSDFLKSEYSWTWKLPNLCANWTKLQQAQRKRQWSQRGHGRSKFSDFICKRSNNIWSCGLKPVGFIAAK